MAQISIVVVGDEAGPVGKAVVRLGELAKLGIVRPFWYVEAKMRRSRPWPAVQYGLEGKKDVALFSSLGNETADEIRVAAVACSGDAAEPSKTAEVAEEVITQLEALAPADATLRMTRLWFPDWEETTGLARDFFSARAHSNLVVVSEDRRSDNFFAAPVTPPDGESFIGHVAAELSVLVGMLAGMEGTPTDGMKPGVFFGNNPKIRLARSFLRIGQSPVLPLQDIVHHQGRLPIPPGAVEAPSPSAAVADLMDRSGPLLDDLAFKVIQPDELQRHQLEPGETLSLVLKEMGSFVVSLPRRAAEGMLEDFSELAGRTMQDLVGSSSVVEVVWKGKVGPRIEDEDDFEALIADLKKQAVRRLDLQGGPSIDQTVWRDIGGFVLSTVDGGELPRGIEPIEVHGRRAVVNDAEALAPRPEETLVATAASILDESESESPTTMLGRLGARVEQIAVSNREAVSNLLDSLDTRVSELASYRPPSLAFWHIAGGVLLAAFVVSILLFSGAVRGVGVTQLVESVRNLVFGILTLGVIGFLYLLRSYGREALKELAPHTARHEATDPTIGWAATGLGALIGAVAAGIFTGVGVAFLDYPATDPATYAAVLAGAVTGAGLGQAYSMAALEYDLAPLGRMSRLSVLAVLIYVSIILMGAIAQPAGWYATASGSEIRSLLLPVSGILLLLLLIVLAYVSWRRVQERYRLNAFGQSIKQLAFQMNDALTGDRVADAAREQFLGLSAVLSRLIWFPYGKSQVAGDMGLELETFGVNKAGICQFELSDRGRLLFETRTKAIASERGWLSHQYETSVLAFREDLAALVGADSLDAIGRPDEDPNTVAHYDMEERSDKGDRWRWAELIFDGNFDLSFLEALESHGEDEIFEPILADSANFQSVGDCASAGSLVSFMLELVPEGPSDVDVRYFDPDHLAGGAFSRGWNHQVWLPDEHLFQPSRDDGAATIKPLGSLARGTVWMSARADMTEDLEPAAIFGGRPAPEIGTAPNGPDF